MGNRDLEPETLHKNSAKRENFPNRLKLTSDCGGDVRHYFATPCVPSIIAHGPKTIPHRLNLTSDFRFVLYHHLVTPVPPAAMLKATSELDDRGRPRFNIESGGKGATRKQRDLTLSLVDG